MSTGFVSRRRAEQFQALLDERATAAPAGLETLAALTDRLAAVPAAAPRPEFSASLRERLMAEAPTALAGGPAADAVASRLTVSRPARTGARRERRLAVAIAALSVVGATTATAVASQGTLPGDTLYPVKRALEDVHTSLAMGDRAKADTLLARADDRLDEVRRLAARDDAGEGGAEVDVTAVRDTLDDFRSDAGRASGLLLDDYAEQDDAGAVDTLRTFTEDGIATIGRLSDVLPPSLDDALAGAARTLLDIDHTAAETCATCSTAGITELPTTLVQLLGSVAATTGATPSVATPPAAAPAPAPVRPSSLPAPNAAPASPVPAAPSGSAGSKAPSAGTLPSGAPTSVGDAVGDVGGAVGGAVGGVGGAVGGLGDQVGGPVGGVLGGAGDTVGGLGSTVGGTVGGVGSTLDGLLGGLGGKSPSPTPKP